jgi:hypothetical protein
MLHCIAAGLFLSLLPVQDKPVQDPSPARDDAAAEKLGWRLGVQAWTFRDRTAFEAIDTAAALGLRYIELYPGQQLSSEHGEPASVPRIELAGGCERAGGRPRLRPRPDLLEPQEPAALVHDRAGQPGQGQEVRQGRFSPPLRSRSAVEVSSWPSSRP